MKTVEFDDYEFEVPEWAKFITKDPDGGDYFVWSNKPKYSPIMDEYLEDYWNTDDYSFTHVRPIRPVIMPEITIKEI